MCVCNNESKDEKILDTYHEIHRRNSPFPKIKEFNCQNRNYGPITLSCPTEKMRLELVQGE